MTAKKPEVIFDLDEFLRSVNGAFVRSAEQLRTAFQTPAWKDSPFVYHMPKMSLSVNVALSYSDGKVKGFFRKTTTTESQELASTIEIDVVSVPRSQATGELAPADNNPGDGTPVVPGDTDVF
jgi:hypothetical protein